MYIYIYIYIHMFTLARTPNAHAYADTTRMIRVAVRELDGDRDGSCR